MAVVINGNKKTRELFQNYEKKSKKKLTEIFIKNIDTQLVLYSIENNITNRKKITYNVL